MAKMTRYGYKMGSETIIEAFTEQTRFNKLFRTKKQVEKQIKILRESCWLEQRKQTIKIFKITITY